MYNKKSSASFFSFSNDNQVKLPQPLFSSSITKTCGDSNKTGKIVTIDFLLGGGDSVYALKYAHKTENCEVYMRDVVIDYIKNLSAQGKTVEAQLDGRAVVIKDPAKVK